MRVTTLLSLLGAGYGLQRGCDELIGPEKHKGVSHVRNAMIAMGRISALYEIELFAELLRGEGRVGSRNRMDLCNPHIRLKDACSN